MSAFDPAAWLDSFEAVGGWYVVTRDDRISVGWIIENRTNKEHEAALRLFKAIQHHPDRVDAVKAHALSRRRVPA